MLKKIRQINQAGITLIALVVTIIVLLILAGVTINLVLGENGIIGKSKLAYETQTRAVIEQEIEQAKGYGETYKQTWTGSYLEKVQEFLSNDEVLKAIGETTATLGSKNGENFVILSVGVIYNFKITEDGEVEWLENAEAAADLLRPEIVNLQEGDLSFSFSPSTPNQGPVTVTITEKANLDKKGNTLRYKIGTSGTWTDYIAPFNVSDNCTIYAALYNGKDYGSTATGEVSNIDTTAPTSCTFTIDETTTDSITVTATAADSTGIKYFDFSLDGGSTYPAGNRQTIATPTSGSVNKTFTFTGLSSSTTYTIRVKASDGAFNYLESDTQTAKTKTEATPIAGKIYPVNPDYIAHLGELVRWEDQDSDDGEWRLFYADTNGEAFLIRNQVYLECYSSQVPGYESSILSQFGLDWNPKLNDWIKSGGTLNENKEKYLAAMTDTNNWSEYITYMPGAKWAIGGPPLELFIQSYNTVHDNSTDNIKLDSKIVGGYYKYGKTTHGGTVDTYSNSVKELGNTSTIDISLFCGQTFYLASPCSSTGLLAYGLYGSYYNGLLTGDDGRPYNLRPLACVPLEALTDGRLYLESSGTPPENNSDIKAPFDVTFSVDKVKENSITVTASAKDKVGVKYFDFSIDGGATYPLANRKTIENPTAGNVNYSHTFTGLSEGTTYSIKVKATDEAGNSAESETKTRTAIKPEEVVFEGSGKNANNAAVGDFFKINVGGSDERFMVIKTESNYLYAIAYYNITLNDSPRQSSSAGTGMYDNVMRYATTYCNIISELTGCRVNKTSPNSYLSSLTNYQRNPSGKSYMVAYATSSQINVVLSSGAIDRVGATNTNYGVRPFVSVKKNWD